MSKKQINELAKDIYSMIRSDNMSRALASLLYDKGWRMQREVIEEYRKKVYSKMEKYTVFGREYIQRIMREVEKEMKGADNE